MCRPTPAGSQHARRSIWTRTRGGKLPRPSRPRSVEESSEALDLVAPTEPPDRRAVGVESSAEFCDEGVGHRHGEQCAGALRNALRNMTVAYDLLQERNFVG
jgi:hypothetical protein